MISKLSKWFRKSKDRTPTLESIVEAARSIEWDCSMIHYNITQLPISNMHGLAQKKYAELLKSANSLVNFSYTTQIHASCLKSWIDGKITEDQLMGIKTFSADSVILNSPLAKDIEDIERMEQRIREIRNEKEQTR